MKEIDESNKLMQRSSERREPEEASDKGESSFESTHNFLTNENGVPSLSWGLCGRHQTAGAKGRSESESMGSGKAQSLVKG